MLWCFTIINRRMNAFSSSLKFGFPVCDVTRDAIFSTFVGFPTF